MVKPRGRAREFGRIGLQPVPGTRIDIEMVPRGCVLKHHGHSRRGFGEIHTIIEIGTEGKRKFIKQQELGREFGVVRYPVKRRIVPMHILVHPLYDVRKRLNMMHFGLGAVPFGKRIDLAQVFGVGDATLAPGTQRVFKPVQPCQILDNEIRIGAEGVAVIEMVEPVVN